MAHGSVVSSTAADICAALNSVLAMIWFIVVIIPRQWHVSQIFYMYRVNCGLHGVDVSPLPLSRLAGGVFKKVTGAEGLIATGTYSISEAREFFCAGLITGDYCSSFQTLQNASTMMIIAIVFIIIGHLCAAGFLGFFFHKEATETGRKWMRVFLITTPCVTSIFLGLYFFLTLGFGDTDSHITHGTCFWVAFFATLAGYVPLIIFEQCVNKQCLVCCNARGEIKAAREWEQQGQMQMQNYPGGGNMQQPFHQGHQGSMSGGYPQGGGGYGHQGSMPQGGYPQGPGGYPQQGPDPRYSQGPGYQQGQQGYRY